MLPLLTAALLASPLARSAHASPDIPPWIVIDRVEATPSWLDGMVRLRIYVTPVNLQGGILDISGTKKTWTLKLGSQTKRVPFIAGTYQGVTGDLAVAFVIQTSAEFEPVLPAIQQHVAKFIDALPREARVAVVGYDDRLHGSRRTGPKSRALKTLNSLHAETDPGGERELLNAVERARRALKKTKPSQPGMPVRKLMVVISDGKDMDPSPKHYRKVSRRAGREGVRIHSIAYAPDGNRLPLRGLGEISKQSHGTFRFAYSKSGFKGHFDQLLKEVQGQYVLTYFLPEKQVKGKRVKLAVKALGLETRTAVKVGKIRCGEEKCAPDQYCSQRACVTRAKDEGRGVLGWILLIGGGIVGLLVLFVVVSLVLGWRQRRRAQAPAPMPEFAPEPEQPAAPSGVQQVIGHQNPYAPKGQPNVPPTGQHGAMPPSGQHRVVQPTGQHGAMPNSGHHQAIRPSGHHQAQASRPGGAPSLLVIKGPLQGQRLPIHHGFWIGKAPGCHLNLAGDNFASSHHAQILMDTAGGCTLVDKGSTNGTFINGVRATQKRLTHGMLIKVGSTEARFLTQ